MPYGFAGAEVADRPPSFNDVGNYVDIDQYNRRQELDRNFVAVYEEATHYWNWNGQSSRSEYRGMWKSSETSYNNLRFIAGALILNRVISIINAVRITSKHNNNLKAELGWNVAFGVSNQLTLPPSYTLQFRTTLDF